MKENIEDTIGSEVAVVVENIEQISTKPALTEFELNVKEMVTCCNRNANTVASLLKIPVQQVNEILAK